MNKYIDFKEQIVSCFHCSATCPEIIRISIEINEPIIKEYFIKIFLGGGKSKSTTRRSFSDVVSTRGRKKSHRKFVQKFRVREAESRVIREASDIFYEC